MSGLVSESFNPNEYRMAIQASYQSEVGNGNQFTSFQSVVEKIASIAKGFCKQCRKGKFWKHYMVRAAESGLSCDLICQPLQQSSLESDSRDSIQQLTSSMRQMQTLAPWQRSPESSFQTFLITSRSEARAGWLFSFPLTTDKNTSHVLSIGFETRARFPSMPRRRGLTFFSGQSYR